MILTLDFLENCSFVETTFAENNASLDFELEENNSFVEIGFIEVQKVTLAGDQTPYTGDYEITPEIEGQTLSTTNRLMMQDMTINPIPYYDVGNLAGGSTVYIGKELD